MSATHVEMSRSVSTCLPVTVCQSCHLRATLSSLLFTLPLQLFSSSTLHTFHILFHHSILRMLVSLRRTITIILAVRALAGVVWPHGMNFSSRNALESKLYCESRRQASPWGAGSRRKYSRRAFVPHPRAKRAPGHARHARGQIAQLWAKKRAELLYSLAAAQDKAEVSTRPQSGTNGVGSDAVFRGSGTREG
jgi:hypothetical protein